MTIRRGPMGGVQCSPILEPQLALAGVEQQGGSRAPEPRLNLGRAPQEGFQLGLFRRLPARQADKLAKPVRLVRREGRRDQREDDRTLARWLLAAGGNAIQAAK